MRLRRRLKMASGAPLVLIAALFLTSAEARWQPLGGRDANRPAERSPRGARATDAGPVVLLVEAPARSSAVAEQRRSRQRHLMATSIAGATACSITHCLVVPLDVVKTRMQTDAAAAAAGSLAAAKAVLRDAPGRGVARVSAFFNGVRPTGLGYFLQGAVKFGGYELFKRQAYLAVSERCGDDAIRTWQLPIMLTSAAAAEMAATMFLAPLEVLKLRVQTDAASASRGVLRTFASIVRTEGAGNLYAGLAPVAMRQVPYTMTKLVAYECLVRVATQAARRIEHALMPDAPVDTLRPQAILLAGLVAGAAAAVVSHPADLLLTRVCGGAASAAGCAIPLGPLEQIAYLRSIGLRGMYSGLAPRLCMTSIMTSLQFSIYESVRALAVNVIPDREPPKPTRTITT